mgnify:CR=1 FL=1
MQRISNSIQGMFPFHNAFHYAATTLPVLQASESRPTSQVAPAAAMRLPFSAVPPQFLHPNTPVMRFPPNPPNGFATTSHGIPVCGSFVSNAAVTGNYSPGMMIPSFGVPVSGPTNAMLIPSNALAAGNPTNSIYCLDASVPCNRAVLPMSVGSVFPDPKKHACNFEKGE